MTFFEDWKLVWGKKLKKHEYKETECKWQGKTVYNLSTETWK